MKSKRAEEQIKFTVRKNVPLPITRRPRSAVAEKASALQPQEMLLVEGLKSTQVSQRMQCVRKEFPSRDYVIRTVDGGVGIWRTK
jgi:hypothetical protein